MTPLATYRLQLHAGFGFSEATRWVDYLADLGVSHVYLSPILQAAPDSTHGYDVVDHTRISDALGGERAYREFSAACARAGLSQVLDLVPNHMAIGTSENRWWWDVLENGPHSRFAIYFDVDWAANGATDDRVLVPVLGDHYGRVLESGELKLELRDARFVVRYYDKVFPLSPASLGRLLEVASERIEHDELLTVSAALRRLPDVYLRGPADLRARHREKESLFRMIERLLEDPAVAAAAEASVSLVNGTADEMDQLLSEQNYRLAYWRTGRHELEYRRFFDIDTLVGLRMEDEEVFLATHAKTLDLVEEGFVTGLRIDHVDGLRDPRGYLTMLHRRVPTTWVVVEKILEADERLPEAWPIAGTSGYEFSREVTGLWIDPEGLQALDRVLTELSGRQVRFEEVRDAGKRRVLQDGLRADVERLVSLLELVTHRHRRHRDHSRATLRRLIEEYLVSFPVYRTYVAAGESPHTIRDRQIIEGVAHDVLERNPGLDAELVSWMQDVLLFRIRGELESELALRFQQLTGPVMAKGVEDTALYRYPRLLAANDVGLDPSDPSTSLERFHAMNLEAQAKAPLSMSSTSTHDSKRSEDVRARLAVLSEVPEEWARLVSRLDELASGVDKDRIVDAGMRYTLFQTLIGAWPISVERLRAYLLKSAREAKLHTSWTSNDADYEGALTALVEALMESAELPSEIDSFVARIRDAGWQNSLAQTLIKLTSPGVPDIYQGNELWDYSLVDPDNRRPVDFEARAGAISAVKRATAEEAWERRAEGLAKMYLTHHALRVRREQHACFGPSGEYAPLTAEGEGSDRVIAYCRGGRVLSVAMRWSLRAGTNGKGETVQLPEGSWFNVLDCESHRGRVEVATLVERFPVGLLVREEDAL
ncbi:MAG: malto-oligosyltrehalose synthase [Myxococcales bacterium]|nr:malto-oligosyltrehalose synthase [Myxococcales bacterium]